MRHLIGIALLLCTLQAWAADITVSDARARATAPGQDTGSIEFSILSKRAAKLVAAASPVADGVEIHSMTHENGKMVMRPVDAIDLPAGRKVNVSESYHVMLTGLKHPLKAGERVPFSLTVEFPGKHKMTVKAKAEVQPLSDGRSMENMHDMGDMHGMEGMKGM